MCWEIDYKLFAEQQKARDARLKEEQRRDGVIAKLLDEANKQSEAESAQETTSKEAAPAK